MPLRQTDAAETAEAESPVAQTAIPIGAPHRRGTPARVLSVAAEPFGEEPEQFGHGLTGGSNRLQESDRDASDLS